MTTSEKIEQKKVELSRLRDEYVAQKNKAKVGPRHKSCESAHMSQTPFFDLGEQNRKLVDIQVSITICLVDNN